MHIHVRRGKRIRVFLCGDYQFLSHMFGISGASGVVYFVHITQLCVVSMLYRTSLLPVVPYPL